MKNRRRKKMKAWYDEIDSATLQRIKTYSAFNDATSKNLMIQTMYEYREKEIQDFKETNHELAELCIQRKKRIDVFEKENAKAKDLLMNLSTCLEGHSNNNFEFELLKETAQFLEEKENDR
jgi:hypothetical protein